MPINFLQQLLIFINIFIEPSIFTFRNRCHPQRNWPKHNTFFTEHVTITWSICSQNTLPLICRQVHFCNSWAAMETQNVIAFLWTEWHPCFVLKLFKYWAMGYNNIITIYICILNCCLNVPLLKEMFVLVPLQLALVPQSLLINPKATLTMPYKNWNSTPESCL